jgi:hypothetical protein
MAGSREGAEKAWVKIHRNKIIAKIKRMGRWAITMTKVRIRKLICKTRWQLVTFLGPSKRESKGIVDLIAIRKDHSANAGLKKGDLFEIILIQVKGGMAPDPDADDRERLRVVGLMYRAKAILLAHWKKGKQVDFYKLKGDSWQLLASPLEVFR